MDKSKFIEFTQDGLSRNYMVFIKEMKTLRGGCVFMTVNPDCKKQEALCFATKNKSETINLFQELLEEGS